MSPSVALKLFRYCFLTLSTTRFAYGAGKAVAPQLLGRMPQPTPAPFVPVDMFKRDDSQTCGYVMDTDSSAYAVTCGGSLTCGTFTNPSETFSVAGCCDGDDCDAKTTCYDATEVSTCVDCSTDTAALLCSESDAPYCYLNSFVDADVRGLGCGTESGFPTSYGVATLTDDVSSSDDTATSEDTSTALDVSSAPRQTPSLNGATSTPPPRVSLFPTSQVPSRTSPTVGAANPSSTGGACSLRPQFASLAAGALLIVSFASALL
ncbi:hypothetical protein EJ04DRAFT_572559 [Polyplosphaeria fusca]|uniref:Uncharacterized protein n=1 Tax=Polyplosphaeria fusca TaxID=682080 RepID=A0A9P4V990_9PLEO|nr:hypothetical protein EJ04DRAFT_572559 [Polyplosphaeria fusca]